MKNGSSPAKESIWQYFVTKCSVNLHVVLCMSPTGDTLRTRCRNFPGLINNAIIDWFLPWPEQALYAVSTSLLAEDVSNRIIKENKKIFSFCCINILILIYIVYLFVWKKSFCE